ncbi:MAG: hypothetical protein PHS49_06175, partial [Candidatus Gracilibacteria bacterium]|nr:hypothetical protein [Candidatus Gracilibacteria bacterium]
FSGVPLYKKTSQKREVRGRNIFLKGAYKSKRLRKNISDEEIRRFSGVPLYKKTSQKREVRGRNIFLKGAYKSKRLRKNISDEEIRHFSGVLKVV